LPAACHNVPVLAAVAARRSTLLAWTSATESAIAASEATATRTAAFHPSSFATR
jgi:hypothetical protein